VIYEHLQSRYEQGAVVWNPYFRGMQCFGMTNVVRLVSLLRLSAESRRLHGCDVSGGTRHVGETGHSCQVVGVLDLWAQLIRRKSYRGFNQ
jgi:hypothetical protein